MLKEMQEIRKLALEYSKDDLGRMVQLGLLDPQKAMMAGMMIQRIEQQNAKPPQTTAIQDVLGLPAVTNQPQPPQQPQPQMPSQGVAALPPQGAPSAGVAALPSGIKEMAGGGIVAFDEGGEVSGYNGEDGSFVNYGIPISYGGVAGGEDFFNKPAMPYGEQMRNVGSSLINALRRIVSDPSLDQKDRAAAKAKLEQISPTYPDESRRGAATFTGAPPAVPAAPVAPSPSAEKEARGPQVAKAPPLPAIARPEIDKSTFEEKVAKATPKVPDLAKTEVKAPGKILEEQNELYKQAGYDPDVFNNMIKGIEEKKGKAASEKDAAVGLGIMKAGLRLMGSREGQEFQELSAGAQEGLNDYAKAVEKIKDRQEKYDERIDQFRLADAQAKRTGAESALARRDKLAEMLQNDERALFTAKSQAANVAVQAATSMNTADKSLMGQLYVSDKSAETQRYVAGIQAQTQREYTNALRAQGIEVNKAKILIDAAGDFISKNAGNPLYMQDPSKLQSDAMAYANSMAVQLGVVPKGANMAPPPKPNAAAYENKYGLPPVK
jgi:hypothetical protein